jgi:hypothetical protein
VREVALGQEIAGKVDLMQALSSDVRNCILGDTKNCPIG